VAVCPTDCLAMADLLPWLPRPRDCIACDACEAVCPADAIRLKPIPPA
jgi:NAD-dependent dihydropyrimidine dehydrogenase PreA subunit